jgi:hypothetical protein
MISLNHIADVSQMLRWKEDPLLMVITLPHDNVWLMASHVNYYLLISPHLHILL